MVRNATRRVGHLARRMFHRFPAAWQLVSQCRVALQPGNARGHMSLGHALSRQGKHARASESFRRAAALSPDLLDSHLALGRTESLLGRHEAAALAFNQAIKARPDSAEAHGQLGRFLEQQGKLEAALQSWQTASKLEPDRSQLLVSIGTVLTKLGRHEEGDGLFRKAAACLRTSIDREPTNFEAHYLLGEILLRDNDFTGAIQSLVKAADLQPEGIDLILADALVRAGRQADAVERCVAGSRARGKSAAELADLGGVLACLGELPAAETCWERALALEPDNLGLHAAIWSLLLLAGELDMCRRYFVRNLEVQRRLAKVHTPSRKHRYLRSYWTRAIGHISQMDRYTKAQMLGWRAPQHTVVLAGPEKVPNPCYLDHMRSLVEVVTDPSEIARRTPEARYLEEYYAMVSLHDGETNVNLATATALIQNAWEANARPPLFRLSESIRAQGRQCLQALGVPPDAWFVGLHVRDCWQSSCDHLHGIRNGDIRTYAAAAKAIADRGGWVIRMGDPLMKPMPPMPQVIDYAHCQLRSDWMDVFLCAACRFFIGSQSGLSHIPTTFAVPSVITNWISYFAPPWGRDNLFIPKRCWSEKLNRYLTFSEIVRSGLGFAQVSICFTRQGVRIEDNKPEDIRDVVEEIMDRLDGRAADEAEDKCLQDRFDKLAEKLGVVPSSPVGTRYLRKYAGELLA